MPNNNNHSNASGELNWPESRLFVMETLKSLAEDTKEIKALVIGQGKHIVQLDDKIEKYNGLKEQILSHKAWIVEQEDRVKVLESQTQGNTVRVNLIWAGIGSLGLLALQVIADLAQAWIK